MDGPTWSRGLVASMSDPSNVLFEDADLCVIRDKYPKGKTHLLVLAKDPNLVTLKNLKSEHADLVRKMVKVGLDQAQSLDGYFFVHMEIPPLSFSLLRNKPKLTY